jgi:Tol biopolymer transport system component
VVPSSIPWRRLLRSRALLACCLVVGGVGVLGAAATVAQASGGATLLRTVLAAPTSIDPNGASNDPSLSATGQFTAFSSQASNLGPAVGTGRQWNVYVFNDTANQATLISTGPNGAGNGPSTTPSISSDGSVVAFASSATNLVANTPRHISDIFVRATGGQPKLLSVGPGGIQPDAASTQPAVSANGLEVAFTSNADDLVPGNDNAVSNVFVANVATGAITLVSVSSSGAQANGPSYNPSISADGTLVSFTSTASNLGPGGRRHLAQVYVHNMTTGATHRVSVSNGGSAQNATVPAPFTQFSDLSGDGHYVVFDSNATNLVPGLTGAHTEVFRHSLDTGHNSLVSHSSALTTADNDSFYPATSSDGRITVFDSFADNLVSPWAPIENVFAQDLDTNTIMTPDVAPDGTPRSMELDAQLLQHAAISGNGQVMAFMSGADNLVAHADNGVDNVYLRVISPPTTSVVQAPPTQTSNPRPTVQFAGSTPLSTFGLCVLGSHREICPMGRPFQLPHVGPGPHTLSVYAGAPGLLFDPTGVTVHFTEN